MNFPFYISKRYLFSKKSHNAINVISLISVGGICIGTAALVIVLSAFNGLSDLVGSLYGSFDPTFKITAVNGKTFDSKNEKILALKNINELKYSCEVIEENALLKYRDQQCVATIKGVDNDFIQMSKFDTLVREGEFILQKGDQTYAVIGKGVSYVLNAAPNDFITPLSLYAPKRGISKSINPEDAFNEKKAYVSGIFSINDDFDFKYVFLPIAEARQLFDYTTEVSAIEVGLVNDQNLKSIQQKIKDVLGNDFEVKNKHEQNDLLFKTLSSEKLWTSIILVFILLVATFNIIGSLTMLIIEKKRDIHILHHLGADTSLIRKIFFYEGVFITSIGAALGLLLGIGTCFIQIIFKPITFGDNYVVDAYPVSIQFSDIVLITIVVLVIGLITSWIPVKVFTKRYLAA